MVSFFTAKAQYYTESDSAGNTTWQMNYYFNQGTIFPVNIIRTLYVLGQDSLGVYVYLFKDSLPVIQANSLDGSFVVTGLLPGTQYQLAVTTKNSNAEADLTYNFLTTGVASIQTTTKAASVQCYAFGGTLKISGCGFLMNSSPDVAITIHNILGQEELSQKITSDAEAVDISHFSKGIHFVSLGAGRNTITRKIVIE
jgi:hypothetical protein